MSVGPMGMMSSIAGSPVSRASDTERIQQDSTAQTRQTQSQQNAESAAGIGETKQDQETSDRDADGHRLWEQPPRADQQPDAEQESDSESQSRDPSGNRGANLDLSG